MQEIEHLIPPVAQMLGVDPATLLLVIGLVVAIANLVGRLIPDDATGFLAVVRKLSKLIGLYASNRISSKLTVNDVATTTVPMVEGLSEEVDSLRRIATTKKGR